MPVTLPLPTGALDNGDPFGVDQDDNYAAYVQDPLTLEWITPGELADRQAQRQQQNAQPPAPETNSDQPPNAPPHPAVSAVDPSQADGLTQLSAAARMAARVSQPAPGTTPPYNTTDQSDLASQGELDAQGPVDTSSGVASPQQVQDNVSSSRNGYEPFANNQFLGAIPAVNEGPGDQVGLAERGFAPSKPTAQSLSDAADTLTKMGLPTSLLGIASGYTGDPNQEPGDAGFYRPGANTINLNPPPVGQADDMTAIHEALHAFEYNLTPEEQAQLNAIKAANPGPGGPDSQREAGEQPPGATGTNSLPGYLDAFMGIGGATVNGQPTTGDRTPAIPVDILNFIRSHADQVYQRVHGTPPPQPTQAAPYTPDTSKDALTSEGELETMLAKGPQFAPADIRANNTMAPSPNYNPATFRARTAAEVNGNGTQQGDNAFQPVDVDTSQQWADPFNVGNIFQAPTGARPPQNVGELMTAQNQNPGAGQVLKNLASGLPQFYTRNNVSIPIVTPALTEAAKAIGTAVQTGVNASPVGEALNAIDAAVNAGAGTNIPNAGQAAGAVAQSLVPTKALDIAATAAPLLGEAARAGAATLPDAISRLAAPARAFLEDQATQAGYPDLETALRSVITEGEVGAARLPRIGGMNATEVARARNAALPGAETGTVGNQLRQAQPITEEMQALGEGVQMDPGALGLPDRQAVVDQLTALRANPAGKTAQIGTLEAQLEALDAIQGHDAVGAYQQIADQYQTLRGSTPQLRARVAELGRINDAMLHPEEPGTFAPNVLAEPPAGATFDPITHELQAPGANNLQLSTQAPPTPPTRGQAALPGAEGAGGAATRLPAPLPGSMQAEGFRGEQGGLQAGLEGMNAGAAAQYQPGLGEAAALNLGAPASDVSELDRLLAQRAENQRLGRTTPGLDQRILELGRKTPYDTPDIIAAREEQLKLPSTHTIDTPERQQLRQQIANKLYGDGAAERNREADIVLGPPAAGKSSALANPLAAEHHALIIDPDAAKELLPEFNGGRYAGAVHIESDGIAGNVLARATGNGDNIVLPLVGKNQTKIDELGQKLHDMGYTVRLHYVDVPEGQAAQRAVSRFQETGRFVDPDYILNGVDSNPRQAFDALKGKDWVDGYSRLTNDVPRGSKPITLESAGSLERPAVQAGAEQPGVNDLGRLPGSTGPVEANPIGSAESEYPGWAESLADIGGTRARAAAARDTIIPAAGGERNAADVNAAGAGLVGSGSPAPAIGSTVTLADGTQAPATPDAVESAIQRFLNRPSGVRLTDISNPDAWRQQLLDQLQGAKTVGGRLLMQGVDPQMLEDALDHVMLDGNFSVERTPGRGRFAAFYRVGGQPETAAASPVSEAAAQTAERAPGTLAERPLPSLTPSQAQRGITTPPPSQRLSPDLQAIRNRLALPATDPEAVTNPAERAALQEQLAGARNSGIAAGTVVDENAKLPRALAGANPTYRDAVPQFASDIDKAAYIAAQTTPSKRDADYVNFVIDQTGLSEGQVRELGAEVKRQVGIAYNAREDIAPQAKFQVDKVFGNTHTVANGLLVRTEAAAGAPPLSYNEMVDKMGKTAADRVIRQNAQGTGNTALMEGGNGGEVPPGGGAPTAGGTPPPQQFSHNVADKTYGFVGDLYNEFKGLVGAAPTLKTMLHLPVFRQGLPYLVLHPIDSMGIARDAIHSMASSPFADRIMQAALARPTISGDREALNAAGFKNMLSAQDAGLRISSYDVGASAEEREAELQGLGASRISRFVQRIPGVTATGRGYTVEENLTRAHWYETVATKMDAAGVKDPREYKALADTLNHWTQYGTGRLAKQGEIPFLFSQRAAVGRVQALTDAFTQPGSLFRPSARQEAARALVALVGGTAALIGAGVASGAGKAVYQNKLGIHLPTLSLGNTTVNPWAGFSGPANLVMGLTQDAEKMVRGQSADPIGRITEFVRSDLGPIPGKILDVVSKTDYAGYPYSALQDFKSGQMAEDLFMPMFASAIWDAIKASGPTAAWKALPSLGGMSVSSYPPSLTQLRDQAAAALGKQGVLGADGQPLTKYANALPTDQQTINKNPDVAKFTAANQTAYQLAKQQSMAPANATLQGAESDFQAGTNTTRLSQAYHDYETSSLQSSHDLEDQFASTFSGFNKSKYETALDGYYSTNNDRYEPGSTTALDYDATAAARAAFLATQPKDVQQWIQASLQATEANKTPLRQQYDSYIAAKKAAGYFALDPTSKTYAADKAALDAAHPDIDAMAAKFNSTNGAAGADLHSAAAVALALKDNHPNMPVKADIPGVGSMKRPINQSPQSQQAWQDSQALLQKYADTKTQARPIAQAHLAQGNTADAADYRTKSFAQLTPAEQGNVDGYTARQMRLASPQLDALLVYWGISDSFSSKAAVAAYAQLTQKYGPSKATPDQKITISPNAP